MRPWPFLLKTNTQSTVASTQFYNLPFNFSKLAGGGVTVTVSSTKYTPKEAPGVDFWNKLNQSTTVESNIPEWFFVLNGQLGLWPIPSTAGNTITYTFKVRVKDLSIADYSTGAVGTATSGTTIVFGSASSWTVKMAGRWLRITDANSASAGDGEWYEIDTISSATALLKRNYAGETIGAVNAAYTIGQMSLLPEGFEDAPVYEAAAIRMARLDANLAASYKAIADEKIRGLIEQFSNLTDDVTVDHSEDRDSVMPNPNFFITL